MGNEEQFDIEKYLTDEEHLNPTDTNQEDSIEQQTDNEEVENTISSLIIDQAEVSANWSDVHDDTDVTSHVICTYQHDIENAFTHIPFDNDNNDVESIDSFSASSQHSVSTVSGLTETSTEASSKDNSTFPVTHLLDSDDSGSLILNIYDEDGLHLENNECNLDVQNDINQRSNQPPPLQPWQSQFYPRPLNIHEYWDPIHHHTSRRSRFTANNRTPTLSTFDENRPPLPQPPSTNLMWRTQFTTRTSNINKEWNPPSIPSNIPWQSQFSQQNNQQSSDQVHPTINSSQTDLIQTFRSPP